MDRVNYKQALARMAAARKHTKALDRPVSMDDLEESWSDFLVQHSRFFNRLRNAMKTDAEIGWFNKIKGDYMAVKDMQYLFRARDADEHTGAIVTSRTPEQHGITPVGATYIRSISFDGGKMHVDSTPLSPGARLDITHTPSEVVAAPVTNRQVLFTTEKELQSLKDLAHEALGKMQKIAEEALTRFPIR